MSLLCLPADDAQRAVPCPGAFPVQQQNQPHLLSCSNKAPLALGSPQHNARSPGEKCPLSFLPTANQPCRNLLTRRYSSLPKIFMVPGRFGCSCPESRSRSVCSLTLRSLQQHLCEAPWAGSEGGISFSAPSPLPLLLLFGKL